MNAMQLLLDHFPVFEANQVLMNSHLNDVFDYLDQQNRQTRTNLIGIGIVCGLDISFNSAQKKIGLTRGCGVTSEGYLIVEPDDLSLVDYRAYTLPEDVDYSPFKDIPLWELFTAGEPDTTPLSSPGNFLADKSLVLFLELKKQGLRNCSPNNCDDKGAQIATKVRRLLIRSADLDAVIAAANELDDGLSSTDIETQLNERFALPDLRRLRFDVVNTGPVTSADVYAGFIKVFKEPGLAKKTQEALDSAYGVFKPLVGQTYPANPFGGFAAKFGFLDAVPGDTTQVRFLQYYVDAFDDILRAYDEFRWAAAELLCMCCPPSGLFPRHLMAGHIGQGAGADSHRQRFIPSPALGACAENAKEAIQLFRRLVEITTRFTNQPPLPAGSSSATIDPQIRVTPSVHGTQPLGNRAIPYYYMLNGQPPINAVWDPQKTRRNRVNRNLGYNSPSFLPTPPDFVTNPLSHDLEGTNFFRIEGHIGKAYERALGSLIALKSRYRLPVDVIAVSTGGYDESQPVDVAANAARFMDLEALYDVQREEILAALTEGTREIYDIRVADSKQPGGVPNHPLLKSHAPGFRYKTGTIGAWFEQYLSRFTTAPYIDINQDSIDPQSVLTVYCALFMGTTGLPQEQLPYGVALYYMMKLSDILPDSLETLTYPEFENRCEDLLGLIRYLRTVTDNQVTPDLAAFIPKDEMMDLCEEIAFTVQLEPIRAIHENYLGRIGELRRMQFLSTFLQEHPGIQHKAGVPIGGTFILVYHGTPKPISGGQKKAVDNLRAPAAGHAMMANRLANGRYYVEAANTGANAKVAKAIQRLSGDAKMALNPDIGLIVQSLNQVMPELEAFAPLAGIDTEAAKMIAATVSELSDGMVIADFYLPYRLSGDGLSIEYVLPRDAPAFIAEVGCTNADGLAMVALNIKGGVAPYDVAIDNGAFATLSGALPLAAGAHMITIRDSQGTESGSQTVTVAPLLAIGTPEFTCVDGRYTAAFAITGGTTPYSVDGASSSGGQYVTAPVQSGTAIKVGVIDARGCSASDEFIHECPPVCDLPCGGKSIRRGYRFWLPSPIDKEPYAAFKLNDVTFVVDHENGKTDLSKEVAKVLTANPTDLRPATFDKLVDKWISAINKIIGGHSELHQEGQAQWLTLGFEPVGPGRFGTLWIEHFECLGFEIRISALASFRTFETDLGLNYDVKGTNISMSSPEANVFQPVFEGFTIDKCDPNAKPDEFCKEAPGIKIEIKSEKADNNVFKLSAASAPANANMSYLWEIAGGQPSIADGETVTVSFPNSGSYPVLVTGHTADGCRVFETMTVTIRG